MECGLTMQGTWIKGRAATCGYKEQHYELATFSLCQYQMASDNKQTFDCFIKSDKTTYQTLSAVNFTIPLNNTLKTWIDYFATKTLIHFGRFVSTPLRISIL